MIRRFERKYRVSARDCSFVLASWRPRLQRAPYTGPLGTYPVLSQYFDTPDFRFHREKQDGLAVRRKVRLRTYGHRFSEGRPCFLEIKERRGELVAKRRLRIDCFHPDLLQPESWWRIPDAGAAQFAAMAERLLLRPSAQVWYVREAFAALVEPDLRLTVDSQVLALHPGERWSSDLLYEGERSVLGSREVILEIKGGENVPAWIERGVRWGELRQQPVPKYGLAVASLGLPAVETGVYT